MSALSHEPPLRSLRSYNIPAHFHTLKTTEPYFGEVKRGEKNFELRSSKDKRFLVGDILHLCQYDAPSGLFTGSAIYRRVGYIYRLEAKNIITHWVEPHVIMSIYPVPELQDEEEK